ncbi:MAG: hypothetical protein MUF45_12410 [Spirosomaceae bacterium]|nr:hypothetical protein [Spirosomataceae bacterium]
MKKTLTFGAFIALSSYCFAQSFTLMPNSAGSNAFNTTTNRVGINTATPNTELHINRNGNVGVQMQFSNATTANSSTDGLWLGIDADGNALLNQRENTTLGFKRNNIDKMLFKTDETIDLFTHKTRQYDENNSSRIDIETYGGAYSLLNLGTRGGYFLMQKNNITQTGTTYGIPSSNLSLLFSEVDLLINSSRNLYIVPGNSIAMSINNDNKVAVNMGTTLASRTLEVNGDVRFGVNGTGINNFINKAIMTDLPSIAAQSSHVETFIINGATNSGVYNSVNVSPAANLTDGLVIEYARVSGVNEVEVKFRNTTNAAINLGFMTFAISIIQWKTTEN